MSIRIVNLEGDSLDVGFREPDIPHEWVAYPVTAQGDVVARLAGAQIAIINKLKLNASDLSRLPDLRMVAVSATGSDNIDLVACKERGIVVSNVRGYAVNTVPEHAILLMLALRRSLLQYVDDVKTGRWERADNFCLFGHPVADLHGAALGIMGKGSLGEGVARLAEAFGMRVSFAEHKSVSVVRDGYVAFESVLRESDVISLHCPLTPTTRGMIGRPEFELMKRTAVLVNTSRGGLADEQALADALREGLIAGAAVDVLSKEPPRDGNPLLAPDMPNLIVTPHVAWASGNAMKALAAQVVENIEAFVAGSPRNRVA